MAFCVGKSSIVVILSPNFPFFFFYPSHVSFIIDHSFSTFLHWFMSWRETEREKGLWTGRVLWVELMGKAAAWMSIKEWCLLCVPAHLHWEPYSILQGAEQRPSVFTHTWVNYSNFAWPLFSHHSHRPLHSSNTYLGAHTVFSGSIERVFTSRLMMITRLTLLASHWHPVGAPFSLCLYPCLLHDLKQNLTESYIVFH